MKIIVILFQPAPRSRKVNAKGDLPSNNNIILLNNFIIGKKNIWNSDIGIGILGLLI